MSDCIFERSMADFYENKNVFVTGGTGFLGTVLLEALLSTTPNIGTIYVLMRGKNGRSARERIEKLLAKPVSVFQNRIRRVNINCLSFFTVQLFFKHDKKALSKIVPVVGELSDENLGLSAAIYGELVENVNIIFHSAAIIKISTYLEIAINSNLTGTYRTIELAKKLKNFTSYIYFSTSFCNTNDFNGEILKEVIYPPKYDPYEVMEMAQDKVCFPREGESLKKFLKGFPNVYTLTKQLAENLIAIEMKDYATGIVRPSIGEQKIVVEIVFFQTK
jgi:nucleoside-diphosphate-sugar epimerase